ncbi:MAG: hypothetical protein ACKPKO_10990, partial [Candidatus Fonsibacter sp.]
EEAQNKYRQQQDKINASISLLQQDLLEPIQADPAQMNIYGQGAGSSEDQAPPSPFLNPPTGTMETYDEPTDPSAMPGLTVEDIVDTGLTSGIIAEQRQKYMQIINTLANDLQEADEDSVDSRLRELFVKKGVRFDFRKLQGKDRKDNKILNFIMVNRGRDPRKPLLKNNDIIKKKYLDGADELKIYPTFVIDRVLKHRKIPIVEGETTLRQIENIGLFDAGAVNA